VQETQRKPTPDIELASNTYNEYKQLGARPKQIMKMAEELFDAFGRRSRSDLVGKNLDADSLPLGLQRDSDHAVNKFLEEQRGAVGAEMDVGEDAYNEGMQNIRARASVVAEWLRRRIKSTETMFSCVTDVAAKLVVRNLDQDPKLRSMQADEAFATLRVFVDEFMQGIDQFRHTQRVYHERLKSGFPVNAETWRNNSREATQAAFRAGFQRMATASGHDSGSEPKQGDASTASRRGDPRGPRGLSTARVRGPDARGRRSWRSTGARPPGAAAPVAEGDLLDVLRQLYPARGFFGFENDVYEGNVLVTMARRVLRNVNCTEGCVSRVVTEDL
tara:strand:+ start:1929 stop:2924 length:996 start_codon:yes stop_codon:yes gene_type:complete